MTDYETYMARADFLSHLAEEMYAGRLTRFEADCLAAGRSPSEELLPMEEEEILPLYMEYASA